MIVTARFLRDEVKMPRKNCVDSFRSSFADQLSPRGEVHLIMLPLSPPSLSLSPAISNEREAERLPNNLHKRPTGQATLKSVVAAISRNSMRVEGLPFAIANHGSRHYTSTPLSLSLSFSLARANREK